MPEQTFFTQLNTKTKRIYQYGKSIKDWVESLFQTASDKKVHLIPKVPLFIIGSIVKSKRRLSAFRSQFCGASSRGNEFLNIEPSKITKPEAKLSQPVRLVLFECRVSGLWRRLGERNHFNSYSYKLKFSRFYHCFDFDKINVNVSQPPTLEYILL